MVIDVAAIRSGFERRFVERSTEITCSLLALLSGEHALFLGPPGTAKSMLARSLCEILEGHYFYYLLTRFTTPEEVFGPLSLKALQEDDFSRKTDGFLPSAHIAFLDEIFKANSSILNSFLTVLNERKFHNGRNVMDVPLISVFGASNELPEDESLDALYDRFLFRCVVEPVQEEANFRQMLFSPENSESALLSISIEDIRALQEKAVHLPIDLDVEAIILRARRELAAKQISVSDRRWKKMLGVLRVAAAAVGRTSVDRSMVLLLQHMAWDKPEQRPDVRALAISLAISGGESVEKLLGEIQDLHDYLSKSGCGIFPDTIRCYDCDERIASFERLSDHRKLHPTHKYYDPYRISLHLRILDFPALLSVLNEDYGWNCAEIKPEQVSRSRAEYAHLQNRYRRLGSEIVSGRELLKTQLRSNVWISEHDLVDVLDRSEVQARVIEKAGKTMAAIGAMLDLLTR
ncbi:AAA family ATPase [Methanocella sp. MCL-LM]|uniref:AAA family ATPase n=1 Tax=Methanocella sp. MCL-LM TaxID=3412035 RepID=UPI003C7726AC